MSALDAPALAPAWTTRAGLEVYADTPLRLGPPRLDGAVRLGARSTPVAADASDVPAFDLLWVYVGWIRPVKVHRRVKLLPGARLGNAYFLFDDPLVPPTLRRESELAAGWTLGMHLGLKHRWAIQIQAGRTTAFTTPRLRTGSLSVGLHRTFDMPERLRAVLR